MKRFILSIDQSTSGTKAIIFDTSGVIVQKCTVAHRQYYPKPGFVEHDAEEIFQSVLSAVEQVLSLSGAKQEEIVSLAITNQRETVVIWDKDTGRPVYNAIVWQCQRAREICDELGNDGYGEMIHSKSGLVLSPYFSAAKIKWVLDNVDGARGKARRGRLLAGTMDSWLIWKLTGGEVHATDYSNASRTQLFNIKDLRWDDDLLGVFDIPLNMLPVVKFSDEIFGHTAISGIFCAKLPISGVLGDSHAALFGQNCYDRGMAKATYGTGSSLMLNIGKSPLHSKTGLVTSIAWGRAGEIDYVLEGNINYSGATIKWLVDSLSLLQDPRASGQIASSMDSNGGVYFVPAFSGLGAPYWNSEARAMICGMSMNTKKEHVIRAAEESIAYQVKDILELMLQESEVDLTELRVDGGPTQDDFLMQFQADVLNKKVVRNRISEVSALGSAYMAGLGRGLWDDLEQVKSLRIIDAAYECKISSDVCDRYYSGWKDAVKRALV